ncbi:hypothetical protein K8I61_16470 [bacterium]|nr:hypothetical protein [bacterium]
MALVTVAACVRPVRAAFFGLMVLAICAPLALAQDEEGDEGEEAPAEATLDAESAVPDDIGADKLSPEELEALEERLTALKEQMLQSKSSLKQLLEQVRMGSVSLISVSMLHTHEVGPTFELESMIYTLDGFQIYEAESTETVKLDDLKEFPVYEGSLLPGEHLLTVDMVYRGRGYGIFSYLKEYLFKVKSRYVFEVQEGEVLTLHVTSYDEGSFLTSLKDRLKVRFAAE